MAADREFLGTEETLAPESADELASSETLAAQPGTGASLRSGGLSHGSVALRAGDMIGRYALLERIGAGGMGVVFAAYDPELDRRVAIKLLHPEVAGGNARHRLVREARAMARLSHPNVVAVHDAGELDGGVFLAMEYVKGRTLGGWLAEVPRSRTEILNAFVAAGQGLVAAHAVGLVHRDFKPDNVMVGDDGRVRVMDFGLARQAEDSRDGLPNLLLRAGVDPSLTQTGAIMGTPAYMAPEQYRGVEADARTDQFSYCVALYEALCGERPFEGATMAQLMAAVTEGRRRKPPAGSDLPRWLMEIIDRGLQGDPELRWPSMLVVLDRLTRDPTRQRRRRVYGFAALTLVGGVGLGLTQLGSEPETCASVEMELAEVWNSDQRERIEAAFAATGLPFADDAWARVAPRIDAYTIEWTGARRAACRATVDGDRSRLNEARIVCLEDRKAVLATFVATLGEVDAPLVAKVGDIASGLPRIASCDDPAYLLAEVQPPEDPAVAAQVERVREGVNETLPLEWRAQYGPALDALGVLSADAEAIGYRPLTTQLRFRTGVVLDFHGDYASARRELEECFFAAQADGSRLYAARCANKLVHVLGDHFGEHQAALDWARHAEVAIEAGGLDEQIQGTLANNRGNVLLALDRDDEALDAYVSALELWTRALGPDHVDIAIAHANIARVHTKRGRYDQAIAALDTALALRLEHVGESHPHVAGARKSLALAYRGAGRIDDAVAELRRAVELHASTLGKQHPQYVDSLAVLGQTLTMLNTSSGTREGVRLLREALQQASESEGTEHVSANEIREWIRSAENAAD